MQNGPRAGPASSIINLDTPPRSEVQDERAEEPRKEHSK